MNRNIKTLNAIMQNWDVVQNTIMDANNAAGTALEGNALYMDSIEGRITAFNSKFQELSSTIIDSKSIKNIISAGSNVISFISESVESLGDLKGAILEIVTVLVALKAVNVFDKLSNSTSVLQSTIGHLGSFVSSIGAAVTAITALVSIIDAVNVTPLERLNNSLDSYSSAKNAVSEVESRLTDVRDRMEEINKIENPTFTDEKQLQSLDQEAKLLEREVEARKQLADLQKKEVENDFISYMQDFNAGTNNANNSLAYDWANTTRGDLWGKVQQTVGNAGLWAGENVSFLREASQFVRDIFGDGEEVGKTMADSFYENLARISSQSSYVQGLNNWKLQGSTNGKYSALMEDGSTYEYTDEDILNAQKELNIYVSRANSELANMFNMINSVEYNEQTAPFIDQVYQMLEDAQEIQLQAGIITEQDWLSTEINLDKYSKVKDTLVEIGEEGEITSSKLLKLSNVNPDINAFLAKCTEMGFASKDVVAFINEEFAKINVVDLEDQDKIKTTFESISSSLFSNTEAYKALTAAMDEQASAGVLSIETYNTLLEQIPEINDLLVMTSEGYALNTEAAYDYIEAQNDITRGDIVYALKAAEDELRSLGDTEEDASRRLELQNQIDQLHNMYAATESATGAYKRFLDAQKTPNQDSMYNGVTKAVESVNEGLSSGKIGTDDYRSSLGLLLGGDYSKESGKTVEELTAAGKSAQEISKKYFSDNEIKNVNNFRDALLGVNEAGIEFASFDGTNFKLFDTANVSEVAKALGMGEDAVISLFRLMEAYGANFEWTDILDEQGLEEVKTEVKQDIELNADGSGVEQETNKAKEEFQDVQEAADGVDYSSMNTSQLLDELSKIKEEIDSLSASGVEVPIELTGQYEELRELLSSKGVDVAPWWVKDPSKLFVENTSNTTSHDLNLPGMGGRQVETVQVVPTVDDNAGDSIIQDIQEQTKGNPVGVVVEEIPKHDLTLTPHEQTSKPKHDLTLTPKDQNVEVHVDTSNITSEVENSVPDKVSTTVDANTANANSEINALKNNAQQTTTMTVKADTSSALTKISELAKKAKETVTKFIQTKILGSSNASGTKNATSGMSLVDEKGAELIEHTKSGTFELGTDNGARFTTLDSGDIVHTASETKKILSRAAKIGGFFRDGLNQTKSIIGNAFATGVSGSMSWSLIESITNAVTKKNSSSSSKSSSSSSSAKKAAKGWKTYVEKLFDWVEIRLDRLQTVTDAWLLSAKQAIGYLAKNAELEGALSAVQDQIEATTKAYSKYMETADKVAKKTGLSAAIIKKIQEGTIEISSYSETTRDKISAYQTWFDKANALVDVLSDLRDQERELATEKLDNIIQSFQWRIDRLDAVVEQGNAMLDLKAATGVRVEERDYQDAIDATTNKINELIVSKQALTAEFSSMIARGYIQEGTEDWYDYTSEIEELDKTIIEVKTDLQDLVDSMNNVTLTNLQYALSYLENSASAVSDMMNLHDSQGNDNAATDYEKLIKNGMQQIKNLEAQNAELVKQQSGLDTLSEKYKELQDQIESNNRSIMDMKVNQEQWNDAVLDLKISELEKFRDELTKTNDKYEKQLELQQAIEDLQRASTQRTQRVFRGGGIGFQYEADQNAIQQAQEKFDQVLHNQTLDKIDEVIDSINDFKNDTNVYDINGNLLGQQYSLPNVSDLSALLSSSGNKNVLTSAVEDVFKSAYNEVMRNIANGNAETNLSIGDVIVNSAETPDELAEAIVNDLPNAMVQALYKKLK